MKRFFPAWSGFAMALMVPMWLLSVSASAQSHGSSGGGGGSTSSGSSGGSASSGGSSSSSGGGGGGTGTSHASSGGGSSSGTAVSRGDSGGGGGVNSASGVGSTRSGSDGTLISGSSSGSHSRGDYRSDPITRGAGDPVPSYARPRGDRPTVGTAVDRTGPAPVPGGRYGGVSYIPGGYYPYGYGGLGYGSYYGSYYGYYDPWYDPFYGGFGGGYSGYGGGYYGGGSQYSSSSPSGEEGLLRLKIKPREASVFVDGYYVGLVDEFDGVFQRMHVEAGPHRIEIRAPGYETLTFDVRLVPDRTTTYTGELKKIQ